MEFGWGHAKIKNTYTNLGITSEMGLDYMIWVGDIEEGERKRNRTHTRGCLAYTALGLIEKFIGSNWGRTRIYSKSQGAKELLIYLTLINPPPLSHIFLKK